MYVEIINQSSIYAITELKKLFSRTPHLQVTFCDLFNYVFSFPQNAAGGILKRHADLAVLRGRCQIQNAWIFMILGKTF